MKRKTLFLSGAILSTIHFIMVYSYFWYSIGKYGWRSDGDGSGLIIMIYLLILVFVTVSHYVSPYIDKKHAITITILYAVPLFFILFLLATSDRVAGDVDFFGLLFFGLYGVNFLTYLLAIFSKE